MHKINDFFNQTWHCINCVVFDKVNLRSGIICIRNCCSAELCGKWASYFANTIEIGANQIINTYMYCTLFDRTYMYSTISIPCSFYCKQAWIEPDLSEASVNSSIQFHFSHLIFIQQGLSIKSTHYFMFWCFPVFVLSHACHDNYWETFQVLFHRSC